MKKDKTLQILRHFSQHELDAFLRFLNSPYFNSRAEIIAYGAYLKSFHPNYPESCLELATLPLSLFPTGQRTKKELSYLKSRIFKLLKQFISYEQIRKKPMLLDLYSTWGISSYSTPLALSQLKKTKKDLEQQQQKDTYDLLFHYMATDILHAKLEHNRFEEIEQLLQESIDLLDEFYIVNKLVYAIEIQQRGHLVQMTPSFDNPLMEEIESFLATREALSPRASIYLQLYLSDKYPEQVEDFDRLVALIYEYQHELEASECRAIYSTTINICIRRMRVNREYFAPICLQLFQEGINSEALFENGWLMEAPYNNTVNLGLQLDRIEWTESFIHRHNKDLQPAARSNALYANLAKLTFAKQDFDLTLEHLSKINTNQFRYYLSTKILLIKTFYELGNLDSSMSAVGSLTVYISRLKGVSTAVKKSCLHFCQILHQITSAKSEKRVAKVKEKVQTITPLAEKAWLVDVFRREHPRAV